MTDNPDRISRKAGLTPGTPLYIGVERRSEVTIDVMEFDADALREYRCSVAEIAVPPEGKSAWVNIEGVHNLEIVDRVGKIFGIHLLLLEDIVNTQKRPKFETFDGSLSIMLKMLYLSATSGKVVSEQVSLVIGPNYVLSFQEVPGDVFEPIRDRLRKAQPRHRFLGTDYLAHALVDAIVDNYFAVLERIAERVEMLERRLVRNPRPESLQSIYDIKRMLIDLRRSVWPLREALAAFERSDSELIHAHTRPYLRDLYEHVIQVMDSIESLRETVTSLLDVYLTSINNRTNEVMKVLTIIATIFIPLTFLAGVYGMNFDKNAGPLNMPELHWRYGYMAFWAICVVTVVGLIWFFRRRRWW